MTKETWITFLKCPKEKGTKPDDFVGEVYKMFKELKSILPKVFQRIKRERILPSLLCKVGPLIAELKF